MHARYLARTGSLEHHPELLRLYRWRQRFSLGPSFPITSAKNSLTCDMRLFRVVPILTLFLGARASSLDLGEPAPHRVETRDAGADACYPVNLRGLFPNLCVGSFFGGGPSFLSHSSWRSVQVSVFLQCASVTLTLALSPKFRLVILSQSTTLYRYWCVVEVSKVCMASF
jgi:hypothetical protein